MSNSGDKPSTNGLTIDPLKRLASMKPPRDLSLGGVKPNKKIFAPNLNVTRNKNKGPSTANSREQKEDEKNRRNRRSDKNKLANKNERWKRELIQSGGVFSEGLGSAERQYSRVSYGRDDANPVLKKPTIKVKDIAKIDHELEEQKLKMAFGDGTLYEDESEDFKNILDIEAPVKLPMDGGYTNVKAVQIKQEVIVKTEPSEDCAMPVVEEQAPPDVKEVFEDRSVVNLLKSDKPTLILLQLADTLPGRGGGRDENVKMKHDQPSTSNEEEKPIDNRCQLKDLEEGKIGKLRVHRSGRVTLVLGDTVFEVCSGTKASFHQEVVSVGTNEESRSANLVSLGALQHKLNVTPHWQALFKDMSV